MISLVQYPSRRSLSQEGFKSRTACLMHSDKVNCGNSLSLSLRMPADCNCLLINVGFWWQVMQLPGVGGVHVMPLTKAARQQVLTLQTEGILPMARVTN